MLANLQTVLRKAQRGRYAVGAFNVSDLEQTQAVIQAGKALKSPVIVNVSEKAIAYAGLEEIAVLVRTMAKKTSIPVVLNLDHGRSVPLAKQAMKVGFSGIMFDGSKLSYDVNVRRTATVVKAGKRYGVGVEGEIGQVKYKEDRAISSKVILATPEQAVDFVRRTKVAALAVGIGNNHGLPVPGEHLHFNVLRSIQKVVSVPLVLHGASGTPATSIRTAIKLGICKINIDTDLRLSFTRELRQALAKDKKEFDPRYFLGLARQTMMETVSQKIILFGSKNKA
jgi:fructose-bisphosphate aldolase class II